MDLNFSAEQLAIRDTVRKLVQDRVAPRAAEIDEKSEYPADLEKLFAENGILAIPFPEEYGGISGSSVTICMAVEEIAKVCTSSSLILAVQALGSYPILLAGSEEQKKRLCPPLAEGRVAAYALSEPDSGSDAAAMRTSAKRYGDEYVLSGSKIFITHGSVADTLVVFARTDPDGGSRGTSAFVLEREESPWTVTKLEHKLGIRGSPTAMLAFDEVRVPAHNRLGEEGQGFKIALGVLDRSRPGIGAQALGIAEGAFEYALNYAKERRQFGRPIAEFQGLQFMLADMATQIEAARHLVYLAATKVDSRAEDLTKTAAMAKLFASDMAMTVTTDAVQVLGGYGYIQDYPVERMMRDAKITQIYEGTNQIQRVVIARALLR
ncbi:MAG: acyl-CoA dehydrogenase family protein [Candidatus Dormibacteraeota bacterium]|uniref:Acyl-CoA dehydrogenase family protein n=1 Tax=Candidatus Dormiibacter inghamiae TaxID=3127013 RepID=A0A934K590_9BACT|nr:acyl-CoA dehydrogenase family protein [Candidatus Dormibacteraeota bacterium]MBJ7607022.1 acyl-CoA dehydrogenase family protein [Candidatus Dormibacteraeota bacterium]